MDGHSATSCFVTTNEQAFEKAMHDLEYFEEEEPIYVQKTKVTKGNQEEIYYEGDMGEMVIFIKPFTRLDEITNIEFFTRTG